MNLIITSGCNKKCTFCFAKEKDALPDMTFEQIKKNIGKINSDTRIKILGGEPTTHPQIIEILDELKKLDNSVTLISNMLFKNDELLEKINELSEIDRLSFLINISELNEGQRKRVKHNLSNIKTFKGSFGFTLNIDTPFEEYRKILEFAQSLTPEFSIRTSLPYPSYGKDDEKVFYLYKKYEYMDLLIEFIKWGNSNFKKVHVDCALYPCMFKDRETEEFIMRWLERPPELGCRGGAFDVFSDDIATLCYPAKFIKADMKNYDLEEHAFNELLIRRDILLNDENVVPKECVSCEYFKKKCAGPCAGFFNV